MLYPPSAANSRTPKSTPPQIRPPQFGPPAPRPAPPPINIYKQVNGVTVMQRKRDVDRATAARVAALNQSQPTRPPRNSENLAYLRMGDNNAAIGQVEAQNRKRDMSASTRAKIAQREAQQRQLRLRDAVDAEHYGVPSDADMYIEHNIDPNRPQFARGHKAGFRQGFEDYVTGASSNAGSTTAAVGATSAIAPLLETFIQNPYLRAGTALVAGAGAAFFGGQAQAGLEQLALSDDAYRELDLSRRYAQQRNKMAYFAGANASPFLFNAPGISLTREGLTHAAGNAGMGAGLDLMNQALSGEPIDYGQAGLAALIQGSLGAQTPLGRAVDNVSGKLGALATAKTVEMLPASKAQAWATLTPEQIRASVHPSIVAGGENGRIAQGPPSTGNASLTRASPVLKVSRPDLDAAMATHEQVNTFPSDASRSAAQGVYEARATKWTKTTGKHPAEFYRGVKEVLSKVSQWALSQDHNPFVVDQASQGSAVTPKLIGSGSKGQGNNPGPQQASTPQSGTPGAWQSSNRFQTAAQAEAWLKQQKEDITFVDFDNNVHIANIVCDALDQMYAQGIPYPDGVRVSAQGFSAPQYQDAAAAAVNAFMGINPLHPYWKDPAGYVKKLNTPDRVWSTDDPFHPVFHEAGHLELYRQKGNKVVDRLQRKPHDSFTHNTAKSLSGYAAKSMGEFLSEGFAVLMSGGQLSPDALAVYKANGGIIP